MEQEMENQEKDIQILTLQDEDGNNKDFEIVDEVEYEGQKYCALLPYYAEDDLDNIDEDDNGDTEILIMKSVIDGDDEYVETIDDDDLFDTVAALFDARMDEQFPEDENDDNL